MNRLFSIASLVLSIAALIVSISVYRNPPPAKLDAAFVRAQVDAELQRRESEVVAKLAPKFRLIYADMFGPDEKLEERDLNPRTLDDLFRPMLRIINKMQGN